ncbi:MAG: 4Fe4S-binding leucine-rich repeat protein, partial [Pseudomonadota bacterium]
MPGGPEPVDWQGGALDCAACRWAERLAAGQCGQRWACAEDRYAKRIERFFLVNPDLPDQCLDHPYFEVRANA